MHRTIILVVASLLAAPLWAANPFLAMRVEVRAVAGAADGTTMAIEISVAPEDRERLGDRPWVTTTLSSGDTVIDRDEQRVELNRGSAALEKIWAVGRYQLRVDVESATGDHRGFWTGDVMVPGLRSASTPPPQPATTPTPVRSAPAVPPAGGDAGSDDALPETAAAPVPPAPTPPPIPEQVPAAPALRASVPTPLPPPPVLTPIDEGEIPSGAAVGGANVTVLVTDTRNQPMDDLVRSDFVVEVSGERAPVAAFAGPGTPLHLGFVLAAPGELGSFAEPARRTALRLAAVATGSGGRVLAITASGTGSWTGLPEDLGAPFLAESDVPTAAAERIVEALDRLDEVAGRSLLVVIIGGDDASDRRTWKQALDRAETAGVPILTMAVSEDTAPSRLRKYLRDLEQASGGRSYLVRTQDLLDLTSSLYRGLIEASYAFTVAATGGKVTVEANPGGSTTSHAQRVR